MATLCLSLALAALLLLGGPAQPQGNPDEPWRLRLRERLAAQVLGRHAPGPQEARAAYAQLFRAPPATDAGAEQAAAFLAAAGLAAEAAALAGGWDEARFPAGRRAGELCAGRLAGAPPAGEGWLAGRLRARYWRISGDARAAAREDQAAEAARARAASRLELAFLLNLLPALAGLLALAWLGAGLSRRRWASRAPALLFPPRPAPALRVFLAFFAAQLLGAAFLPAAAPGRPVAPPPLYAAYLAGAAGALLAAYPLLRARRLAPRPPPAGPAWRGALAALAGLAAACLLATAAGWLWPSDPEAGNDFVRLASEGPGARGAAALAPLALLLAPLFEEFLFRGVLLSGLAPLLGGAGAALATAVLFAAVHSPAGAGELAVLFFLGLTLAEVVRRTARLWPAILLHALWNLRALAGIWLVYGP